MKPQDNDNQLESDIRRALGTEDARFDADSWKSKYHREITLLEQAKTQNNTDSYRYRNCFRINWRAIMSQTRPKQMAGIAAAIAIVLALVLFARTNNTQLLAMDAVLEKCRQTDLVLGEINNAGQSIREWWCISKQFSASQSGNKLKFDDYANAKQYRYDPQSDTITISAKTNRFIINHGGVLALLEGLIAHESDGDGKILRHRENIDGHEIEIWNVDTREDGEEHIRIDIDVATMLPIRATVSYGGKKSHCIEFSYPESGPQNIYDLGAPQSATVIEVDSKLNSSHK